MILENDNSLFELALLELSVALKLQLKNEPVAGSSSATDTVNTGTKAKQLNVSGLLPFNDAQHLTDLLNVAEAVDEAGARVVYNISDDTANAADIRQVIFDGDFNARKMKELNAWTITFTLMQKNSIAEAKESRAASHDQPVTDTASGTVVATDEAEASITATNGMIYNMLKKLDDFLAPNENT